MSGRTRRLARRPAAKGRGWRMRVLLAVLAALALLAVLLRLAEFAGHGPHRARPHAVRTALRASGIAKARGTGVLCS